MLILGDTKVQGSINARLAEKTGFSEEARSCMETQRGITNNV
ncbi:hypothetical protein HMPREF9555_01747 [Selenomonas artemidis F0399]|uniref:Uncharacterized protein n=1 Tax=Selenomonas artemidis F0399 TaxID=749551 RepID=E7N406_9FIRM|nr:hypothetical protein HMPREF9555_01747 [Selenomonas artemidis F0399]